MDREIQSKFDYSKRKGPQEIFRMIESSNFQKSSNKSEKFGHFQSDNGMVRFDSFNSAFWRIYENLCTWNEENVFYYKSFIIMSFTTNRLKQTQNKKDNGDSPCQQRKMVA